VRDSPKSGKGLFAKENISKGELVAIKMGRIVSEKELELLDLYVRDFSLQITEDFHLSAGNKSELEDTALFLNHSCDPNIGMDGQVAFIAMRDINAGEELCLDYAMIRTKNYQMECHCGSAECRGLITGEDWKRPDLQEKYRDYFSWHIRQLIQRSY
jgi:SET domain-containing protein